MFQNMVTAMEPWGNWLWLAQAPTAPVVAPTEAGISTAEQASLVFSGPQFFITLVSGLLLAFAIQILLTQFSVAAGISYLGRSSDDDDDHDSHHSSSGSFGSTIKKIGFGLGLWTLITVSIALFVACYLAVQLSLLVSPGLGAIVGLVIWAAYFSLLVWVSSTTVGSLIGSIVNTATSGFQSIIGTAAAAIGAKTVNQQVVSTAEAAAAAVRRELGAGIDPLTIRENIEDYINKLRPAELDVSGVRGEFERLLNSPEVKELARSGNLPNVDRQTFVDLISSRSDLSKRDVNRLADQLESAWKQNVGQPQQPDRIGELVDYLRSTQPGQLKTDELNSKLDQLIDELRRSRQAQPSDSGSQSGSQPGSLMNTIQTSVMPIIGMVMGRADLSDMSVEKIVDRLKSAQDTVGQAAEQAGIKPKQPFSTIRADIENYLMNTYAWQMNRETLTREFRDVLYDPEADPRAVRQELERIRRADFVNILQSRGLLTQDQINSIADQLEEIRLEVITTARAAEEREAALDLRQRVETYLTYTPSEQLIVEQIDRAFGALLEDPDVDYETLNFRLAPYDRATFYELLNQRTDLAAEHKETIINQLVATRDRVLNESKSVADQAKERAAAVQGRLEHYLRNTGRDELNPEGIKRDLQVLFNDPQLGMEMLRNRASHFDRGTLVQLLSQRQDITPDDANRIINQVEENWYSFSHAPQLLAGKAKDQYDQTTTTIADYLRGTNLEELNPEGIQRDLQTLFNDPKGGTVALRRRLSQVDRETLVKLLSQNPNLSEEQVNRAIDQTLESIRSFIRAPRRLASRTQQRVFSFESALEDYLRNTNKEELNPEGIKRDLQLLFHDPRLGVRTLGDRLSQFDRSTLVALLSQRKDMTLEEADRVVAQVESVRGQFMAQIQSVQHRIQSVIDGIFARIRNYLNALERPELNYDGIKQDLRTLFHDPQAGFDALRDRLSHVDRNTLVAIMSSREDISEAQANHIIDQIEGARTSVLRRAERMQHEAQRRLEEVKRQAQRQAEETRKAAATAAWWLFATALVSGSLSAIAGAIAVSR